MPQSPRISSESSVSPLAQTTVARFSSPTAPLNALFLPSTIVCLAPNIDLPSPS
ncbi:hypothetical protein K3495_g16332 [Podosphaera aphanis]|nr:hypothetical protein K3495_g16332 [Podosphaera aphanis]